MRFLRHLLLCQIIKVTAVVLAVFTWVLFFFLSRMLNSWNMFVVRGGFWVQFFFSSFYIWFQQFLYFSSDSTSYTPWKRGDLGLLQVVLIWSLFENELWLKCDKGKEQLHSFSLIGCAFMYSVNIDVVRRQWWCPRCFPATLATFLPVLILDLWSKWLIREGFLS